MVEGPEHLRKLQRRVRQCRVFAARQPRGRAMAGSGGEMLVQVGSAAFVAGKMAIISRFEVPLPDLLFL